MALAGLGAIARGINQGMDLAQRDNELALRQAEREEDRAYKRAERERQQKQWTEDDRLKEDLQAVPEVGEQITYAGESGPAIKTQTRSSRMNQVAGLYRNKDFKASEEMRRESEKLAQGELRDTLSGLLMNNNLDLKTLANQAAKIVDSDSTPIGIRNLVENGDGSISIEAYNKFNGYAEPMTFKDAKELREALRNHSDPEGFRARQKAAYEAQMEVEKQKAIESAKGKLVSIAPGGSLYDRDSGRIVATNNNGFVPTINPDGTISNIPARYAGSSSGSGSGSGVGKAPQDFLSNAEKIFLEDATKLFKDDPQRGAQFSDLGMNIIRSNIDKRTGQPTIDISRARNLAAYAINNPNAVRFEVDPDSFTFSKVLRAPGIQRGQVTLQTGWDGQSVREQLKPDEYKALAMTAIRSLPTKPDARNGGITKTELTRAAFNPNEKAAILSQLGEQTAQEFIRYNESLPPSQQKSDEQVQELIKRAVEQKAQSINRITEMIAEFGVDPNQKSFSRQLNDSMPSLPKSGAVRETLRAPLFQGFGGALNRSPD